MIEKKEIEDLGFKLTFENQKKLEFTKETKTENIFIVLYYTKGMNITIFKPTYSTKLEGVFIDSKEHLEKLLKLLL